MSAPDLRHLAIAPELAQLETSRAVLEILLVVLQHRHPNLDDEHAIGQHRTLTPARHLARRTRALLDAMRRYLIEVDDARIDSACRRLGDDSIPF